MAEELKKQKIVFYCDENVSKVIDLISSNSKEFSKSNIIEELLKKQIFVDFLSMSKNDLTGEDIDWQIKILKSYNNSYSVNSSYKITLKSTKLNREEK